LGVALFKALIPPNRLAGILEARLDWRVLIFAFVVAVIAGILFSIIPAWRTSSVDPHESLKESGRAASSAAGTQKLRSTLLVAEAALALVLLFGAGVIFHAFSDLMNTNPGFDMHHLLAFDVGLDNIHYPVKSTWPLFFERLTDNLRSIPGVRSAVVAENAPAINDFGSAVSIHIPGAPPPRNPFERAAAYNRISPGYFHTLHIPLEKGRTFTRGDDAASAPVAIVTDTFVRHYFHNRDLIGDSIQLSPLFGAAHEMSLKVVGIVHAVRQYSLNLPEIPMIYVPERQDPSQMMTVVVRTGPSPASLIPAVRRRLARVTITQPVWDIGTVQENFEKKLAFQHTDVEFFGGFALITLLLAAIGIYGVAAYGVSQRFHEIGVRMALGATRGGILKMVLKQAFAWVLLGIAIGCALLFPFERLLASMFANSPSVHMPSAMAIHADASLAVVVLVALAVLLLATFIATLIPARRATKVDPVVALRHE
ncbi:MAG: FtsX-like permease family protein, partial [Terriglobia bacterium]